MTGLNKLALDVLRHGDKLSVAHLATMMQEWVPSAPRYLIHILFAIFPYRAPPVTPLVLSTAVLFGCGRQILTLLS